MIQARLAVAMMLLVGSYVQARPISIQDILPQTMPLLPPYCKVRIEHGPPDQTAYWKQRLGPGFLDIHHYCFGLAWVIMAGRTSDKSRKSELFSTAIGDFSYVINHSKPNQLAVMADVYTERGKAYGALNKMKEAFADFKMADEIRQGRVK